MIRFIHGFSGFGLFVVGFILPMIRGHGLVVSILSLFMVLIGVGHLLLVIVPHLKPDQALDAAQTTFAFIIIYAVLSFVDFKWNPLSNAYLVAIERFMIWIGPWLAVRYIVSTIRIVQKKKGADWTASPSFLTVVVFFFTIILLGASYFTALSPSFVGRFRSLAGENNKAILALKTAIETHPRDKTTQMLLKRLEEEKKEPEKEPNVRP